MSDPVARLNTALDGRYRIERELGAGGMATVYLAEDQRHERKVALKVLKPELAAVVGAERFLAEIKTTANLQHPHVLPLFDSGEADGLLFYVMPYVEGESLRERLERDKQLPVDEAVHIATNVAEALDYAHRHAVVHRDIKPANILLQDGKPVVADFGIALAIGVAGGGRLTETGLSLGTPHYMSPEQATGDQSVGAATDIYALGCVLYEMLVGEPPFTGSTAQAVLGQIVTGEPDSAREHRESVPGHVDAAIMKALEKVPADRFATAGAFADVLSGRAPIAHPVRAAKRSTAPAWPGRLLYAGGLLAVAAVTWIVAMNQAGAPSPMRLSIALAPGQELRRPSAVRISADGSMLVYTGPGEDDGDTRLWARRWPSLDGAPIPNTTGVLRFDPSPHNDKVALLSGDSIRIQAIDADVARTVLPGGAYCCLAWSDESDWIYFTNADRGVSRVSPRGGDPEVLTTVEGDADHLWPHPVPGTELVVFELYELFGIDSRLALLHADSREFEEIGEGSYPTPMGDLMLFTSADGTELRYSRPGAAQTVAATTIVTGMVGGTIGFGLALIRPRYDVSSTGDLVYVTGGASAARLGMPVWMERDGTETPIDSTLTGYFRKLRLSPDGSRLLLSDTEGMVIHVKDLPTGPLVPITRDGTVNYRPSWAPDNSAVFYSSNRSGEDVRDIEVFRVRPDGAGEPESVGLPFPAALMTRDGQWWIYRTSNIAPDRGNLMAVPVDGSSDPISLVATDAAEGQPTISRDGRWFAYSSDISGVRQVYVRPFPDAADSRVQVSSDGGMSPAFSPATDELFLVEGGWMVSVTYTTEPTFRETGRQRLFDVTEHFTGVAAESHHYDVSADGQRFTMVRLLELPGAARQQIIVSFDFLSDLEALAESN